MSASSHPPCLEAVIASKPSILGTFRCSLDAGGVWHNRCHDYITSESGLVARLRREVRIPLVMFVNNTWFSPMIVPVEMPMGLDHLDSDFCWCDPLVEVDESGKELVLHRQVTWN
jgi:hypothetical protein